MTVKKCDKCFTKYDDVHGGHECSSSPEELIEKVSKKDVSKKAKE